MEAMKKKVVVKLLSGTKVSTAWIEPREADQVYRDIVSKIHYGKPVIEIINEFGNREATRTELIETIAICKPA